MEYSKKRWTLDKKIETVRLLKEYNFDYKKVGKLVGVPYATMRTWVIQYKDQINDSNIQMIARTTERSIGEIKTRFIQKNYKQIEELFNVAAKKAKEIINSDKASLDDINTTLKLLLDYVVKMQAADAPVTHNNTTLIQASIQTLNQIKENSL